MEHKHTQFTGGATVVTVEVSLGELTMIEETLAAAAGGVVHPVQRLFASLCQEGVSEVIAEAKEIQAAFQG